MGVTKKRTRIICTARNEFRNCGHLMVKIDVDPDPRADASAICTLLHEAHTPKTNRYLSNYMQCVMLSFAT